MKTLVHVNQGNIRQNIRREANDRLPVLRAQGDFDTVYGDHIDIIHPDTGEILASVVYHPDNPLDDVSATLGLQQVDSMPTSNLGSSWSHLLQELHSRRISCS